MHQFGSVLSCFAACSCVRLSPAVSQSILALSPLNATELSRLYIYEAECPHPAFFGIPWPKVKFPTEWAGRDRKGNNNGIPTTRS